ncbi:hypothetical protein STEG23_037008, partial [Scotinomys teguina]
LIISLHLFLLGDFASSCSRAFRYRLCTMSSVRLFISLLSFDLVDLSTGWNLPSSAFCKAGFVDRYCSNLVLSWNVLFTPSMVGPFHGVQDFLDILFYNLFGFGVFLD